MHGRVTGRPVATDGAVVPRCGDDSRWAGGAGRELKERQRFDCKVFYARNYSLSGYSFLNVFVLYVCGWKGFGVSFGWRLGNDGSSTSFIGKK